MGAGQENIYRLYDLFMPFVMDVINWRPDPKETTEELKKMTKDLRTRYPGLPNIETTNLSDTDALEIDRITGRIACYPVTQSIVVFWLRSLINSFSSAILTKNSLDNSMLPIGTTINFVSSVDSVTDEQAREILKRVRASLPEGEFLPEDAKEILRGRGIQIA